MTNRIGVAGRRARDLTLAQAWSEHSRSMRTGHGHRALVPAYFPVHEGPLPLLQRAAAEPPADDEAAGISPPTLATPAAEAIERETAPPSPREVADRVYHLFRRDLRRGRERRGRFIRARD